MPTADRWNGADRRHHLLSPRVITWLWLAGVSGILALALYTFGQDSARQDEAIIRAGKQAVLRNCLDNNRDTRAQLEASNANIPRLVRKGALTKALGDAALKINAERLALASDGLCLERAQRFEREADRAAD
jgi:hypothetical protein